MLFLDPNTHLFLKICFTGYFRLCYLSLTPCIMGWATVHSWCVKSRYTGQGQSSATLCKGSPHFSSLHETLSGSKGLFDFPNFRTTSLFQLWPHYTIPAEAHSSSVHGLPSASSAIPAVVFQVRRGQPEGVQSDQHQQWRMLFFLSQFYAYKNILS